MTNETTRFESRKGVSGWERQNPIIQAGYDSMDRMATLFGEISFKDLFTQPWGELVPRILPKIDIAASYGLISDPAEVTTLFDNLQKYDSGMSFKSLTDSLCESDDATLPQAVWKSMYELHAYHGIKLPEISANDKKNLEVKRTLDQLVELAGDFTYRSMWETPRAKDLKAAMEAMQQARPFVIHIISNHLCCSCGTKCACALSSPQSYCIVLNGYCAAGATMCGGPDTIGF